MQGKMISQGSFFVSFLNLIKKYFFFSYSYANALIDGRMSINNGPTLLKVCPLFFFFTLKF